VKIVVCVKQVPQAAEISFDAEQKRIRREGVPLTLNAFDRRALGEAVRLKELLGGEVVALTMGPPQAREALVECLALGCDRAVHLCDLALAGSDTLVTARVLAAAIQRESPDLVFCGRYSVDAETGQVGPELAELLDLPQATGISKVTVPDQPGRLLVERETDEGFELLDLPLPAVLTAAERLCRPPQTTPEGLQAAAERPIETRSAADLGFEAQQVGLTGSPTWVSEIRGLEVRRERQLLDGEPEAAAERLAAVLAERGLVDGRAQAAGQPFPAGWRPKLGGPAIWAVADLSGGVLQPSSFELLGKGAELAAELGGELAAVLIGGPAVRQHVATLASYGAGRVYLAADERLADYQVEPYTALLAELVRQRAPRAVLFAATGRGRDLAPRLAARLGLGLTADCVGLELDAEQRLVQLKPAFGGLVVAPILSHTRPELATVRPGILPRPEPVAAWQPLELVELPTAELPASRTTLLETRPEAGQAGLLLDDAPVVVAVGTGLGGPEHLPTVEALARALGGAIGATRKVVDLGWLPRQQQIGLTGRSVAPGLYIGVGTSGGFNHSVGILRSGTIVAINPDAEAPIFQVADLGLVGPWERAVPTLTRAIERIKAQNGSRGSAGAAPAGSA
jgi:electron transfer flavoprotein alpha subunit